MDETIIWKFDEALDSDEAVTSWCQAHIMYLLTYYIKYTAPFESIFAKKLNLNLKIKALKVTSSLEEISGIEEQVKWHYKEDKSKMWDILQEIWPFVFQHVNGMGQERREGGAALG